MAVRAGSSGALRTVKGSRRIRSRLGPGGIRSAMPSGGNRGPGVADHRAGALDDRHGAGVRAPGKNRGGWVGAVNVSATTRSGRARPGSRVVVAGRRGLDGQLTGVITTSSIAPATSDECAEDAELVIDGVRELLLLGGLLGPGEEVLPVRFDPRGIRVAVFQPLEFRSGGVGPGNDRRIKLRPKSEQGNRYLRAMNPYLQGCGIAWAQPCQAVKWEKREVFP